MTADSPGIQTTGWIFGHMPTYPDAATRAVIIEQEERQCGRTITNVSIYPNPAGAGYVYCLESTEFIEVDHDH